MPSDADTRQDGQPIVPFNPLSPTVHRKRALTTLAFLEFSYPNQLLEDTGKERGQLAEKVLIKKENKSKHNNNKSQHQLCGHTHICYPSTWEDEAGGLP